MKVFIAIVVVAFLASAQALTDEQKAKLKTYKEECFKTTSADKEALKKIYAGDFVGADDKTKAFVFCFFKHVGFQNEAGEVQAEVIKTKAGAEIGKEAIETVLKECEKKFDDPKETAFHLYQCYYEKSPKHAVLFN